MPFEEKQWKLKQIIGYCKANGMETVSHETVYADIRFDKANGGSLWKWTRRRMKHRQRALYSYKTPMPSRTDIGQRPEEADGKRLGASRWTLLWGQTGSRPCLH